MPRRKIVPQRKRVEYQCFATLAIGLPVMYVALRYFKINNEFAMYGVALGCFIFGFIAAAVLLDLLFEFRDPPDLPLTD
jgi:hypothetical protein